MAVASLAVGALAALARPQSDDAFSITSDRVAGSRRDGLVVYEGNVQVKYGVTFVRADRVTVYFASEELSGPVSAALGLANLAAPLSFPAGEISELLVTRRGVAEGGVHLIDPEGTIKADILEFNPDLGVGRALRVEGELAGFSIKAREARITPKRYELIDAEGSSCPDLYNAKSGRVVIVPGGRGVVQRPRLSLGPLRLPGLPNQTFSLDQRVPGFKWPSLTFRKGSGFGGSWSSGLLIDSQTVVSAGANAFPDALPSFSAEAARSFVPSDKSTDLISPRSELTERFNYGYLENISVASPANEFGYLSAARSTVSLGSYWNQGSQTTVQAVRYSKMIDAAYEQGFLAHQAAGVVQVRAQRIRENDGPFRNRLVALGAVGLKPVELLPGLSTLLRLNVQGTVDEGGSYGWARAHAGLVLNAGPHLRIGAGFMFGKEAGNSILAADQLMTDRAFHLRGDLNLGPTKLSVLAKYDLNTRKWFDHEYSVSQVVGCLEPYLLWRQFPSDYRVGIRLRIDGFLNLLRRREFSRDRKGSGHGHKG